MIQKAKALKYFWLILAAYSLASAIINFEVSANYFITLLITVTLMISIGIDLFLYIKKQKSVTLTIIENSLIILVFLAAVITKSFYQFKLPAVPFMLFSLLAILSVLIIILYTLENPIIRFIVYLHKRKNSSNGTTD